MGQNAPVLGHTLALKSTPMWACHAVGLRLRAGPDALGNALGQGLVEGMTSDTDPSNANYRNEMDRDSDSYNPASNYNHRNGMDVESDTATALRERKDSLYGLASGGRMRFGASEGDVVAGWDREFDVTDRSASLRLAMLDSDQVASDAGQMLADIVILDDRWKTTRGDEAQVAALKRALQNAKLPVGPRVVLDDFGNPVDQLMTLQQLQAVMPNAGAQAERFVGPLNDAMKRYGIDTPERQAAFLAQVAHESVQLRGLEEDLTYSAKRLTEVWPKRFSDLGSAEPYANNPESLGNYVYANRLGNGEASSGDGFRYRGRGLIQLTGRSSYAEFGYAGQPDLLLQPGPAASSAADFWNRRDLNELTNKVLTRQEFDQVTSVVNGGLNGGEDRWRFYLKALEAIVRPQWRW